MIMEIQIGLYQEIIYGTRVTYSKLYSKEGYCFYDKKAKVYDEEGNAIPELKIELNKRQYMRYCLTPLTSMDDINKIYKSVEIQPDFEIV